jgi:NAD(P)-dependent dehydrogenase (short-subunit alcohol dehydrogenase family)
MTRTWLITGCSTGFGRLLAQAALERGDQVVATARDPATLSDIAKAFPRRREQLRSM